MSALFERVFVSCVVGIAVAAAVIGWLLATHREDPHWVNRAGAAIVSMEGLLLLTELSRRARIRHAEETVGATNRYVRIEAFRAEKRLIVLSVAMIAFGEILHGFGDLIFELL